MSRPIATGIVEKNTTSTTECPNASRISGSWKMSR